MNGWCLMKRKGAKMAESRVLEGIVSPVNVAAPRRRNKDG